MKSADQPLVSIIMPAYNAEDTILDAVGSILNQSYQNLEVLVLNDGSDDSTEKMIASLNDPRIRKFSNPLNKGYLRSVNYLFKQCRGEFIGFQDADDVSEIDRLETQVSAFLNDSELMLCGTQCIYQTESEGRVAGASNGIRKSKFPHSYASIKEVLQDGETVFLCGASVVVRRKMLKEFGGYREFFDQIGAEHLDWFMRMISRFKFENLPNHSYIYRMKKGSFARTMSLNPLKYHSAQLALFFHTQRYRYGRDMLEDEHLAVLIKERVRQWYLEDPAKIYRVAGLHQLAFGYFRAYADCVKKAFAIRGLTFENLKFAVIWLPLAAYLKLLPYGYKRSIAKKKNLRQIEKLNKELSEAMSEFAAN